MAFHWPLSFWRLFFLTIYYLEDGFYEEEFRQSIDGPQQKEKVLKHIPYEVVRNAKGLAIFTTMRTGLWVSGAGGSGVLVGRQDDGTWSQPVGIMLHTAGLGFLVGVDIYDCVLVLNTEQALNAFSRWRCTIGGELSATSGPTGVGGLLDTEVHRRQAPVFSYLKSRGFYAGVQIDGTVVIERTDENERFYGQKVSAKDILAGRAHSEQWEIRMLIETLRVAQGEKTIKKSLLPTDPAPADYDIVEDGHVFGVPDREDPDPYGVLALEKEGLQIKEAGSKMRASSEQFDFNPALTSPVFDTFRRSTDSGVNRSPLTPRSSWRRSNMTTVPLRERTYVTSDVSTQTDLDSPVTSPKTRRSRTDSRYAGSVKGVENENPRLVNPADRHVEGLGISVDESREQALPDGDGRGKDAKGVEDRQLIAGYQENKEEPTTVVSPLTPGASQALDGQQEPESPISPPSAMSPPRKQRFFRMRNDQEDKDHESNNEEVEAQDDVIVHEVRQAPQVITKARMVNVPKRVPPKLPERNPGRASRGSVARVVRLGSESGPPSESDATSARSLSIRSEEVGTGAMVSTDKSPTSETGVSAFENSTKTSNDSTQVDKVSQGVGSGGPIPETSAHSEKNQSSPNRRPTLPEDLVAPLTETNSKDSAQPLASSSLSASDFKPSISSSDTPAPSSPHPTDPNLNASTSAPTANPTNGDPDTTVSPATQDTAPSQPAQKATTTSPKLPPPRNKVRDAALRFESSNSPSPPPPRATTRSWNRRFGSRTSTPATPSEPKSPEVNGAPTPVPAPVVGAFSPPAGQTTSAFPFSTPSLAPSSTSGDADTDTAGHDKPTDPPKSNDDGIDAVSAGNDNPASHDEPVKVAPRISLANIRGGLDTDDEDEDDRSRSVSRSRSRQDSPVRME